LEEEQKALNLSMTGCCKNISAIEITVEHYINDLFKNIMESKEGNEGKPGENFAAWVNTYFIAKTEIESKMAALTEDIDKKIEQHVNTELRDVARSEAQQTAQQIMDTVSNNIRSEYSQRIKEAEANHTELPSGGLSKEEVFKIVKAALIQYDADKTGMFDYALETAGGSVVSTRCTETYIQKTAMYSIFGIPIWYPSNNPRTIIQPGVQPGECWAFKGSSGFVVIQLSERIIPTRFSMEHISKSMSPSGKIDSAPKDFVVYGLRHEKDTDPVKLGEYSYSQDQDPLQFYEVKYPSREGFPYIELDIISNHGNLNYTCLYRFRVHGTISQEELKHH
jgi:SUN domain-containing protein 1/2